MKVGLEGGGEFCYLFVFFINSSSIFVFGVFCEGNLF